MTTRCLNPMLFAIEFPNDHQELQSLVGHLKNTRYFVSLFLFVKWVSWRKDVMARILIFDLILHFVCSWFNMIRMKDSCLVVFLVFGTWTQMKG